MIGDSPLARRVRAAATRFTTPLLPDDYLTLFNPLWSARELRGRIVERHAGGRGRGDARRRARLGLDLRARAPASTSASASQIDGRFHWRSYSLTTPPSRDGTRLGDHRARDARGLRLTATSSTASRRARSCGSRRRRATSSCPTRCPARSSCSPRAAASRRSWRCCARWTDAGTGSLPTSTVVHSAPDADHALFADELDLLARRHPGWRVVRSVTPRDRGSPRPAPGSTTLVPDWRERADVGLRTRPRCSTRPRSVGPTPGSARPCTSSASPPTSPAARPRAARSRSPAGAARRGRRRDHRARGRRERPASRCRSAAAWASATPASPRCAPAPSATCATAPSTARPTPDQSRRRPVQTCVTAAAGDCVVDAERRHPQPEGATMAISDIKEFAHLSRGRRRGARPRSSTRSVATSRRRAATPTPSTSADHHASSAA